MKKIIFLDFDGVLHGDLGNSFTKLPLFENYLSQMPDVEVVISSAWRETMEFEDLKNIFSASLRHRIIGITPVLDIGYTQGGRQKEIETFLDTQSLNEHNAAWIALDDIESLFTVGYKYLILVDPVIGLTDKEGNLLLEWYKQVCFLDKFEHLAAMKKFTNVFNK